MSLPLVVKSKLFWYYKGAIDCAWYLSYAPTAKQNAYIDDMDKFGIDTITINLCNEEIGTPFAGEFMNSDWDWPKVNRLCGFIQRLKARGKNVVIVFFDCPEIPNARYPVWKFKARIPAFLTAVTGALAPVVDGFILGIETNRGPLTGAEVDQGVYIIKQSAFRMINGVKVSLPVGTHEQSYRIASQADFIGYETKNHPFDGHTVPVAQMVAEVKTLVARANGKAVWVIESNEREDAHARAQNRAMAALPGVVGVGGPL